MKHAPVQLNQFTTITSLTALEIMRQPISLLLMTTTVVFIALLPVLVSHTLGGAEKLVRDSALAMYFVSGLLLGSYASCSTLAHEIRRGTASAVLSKPVGREIFLLAKFTGVAVVMVLFGYAATLSTVISERTASEMYHIDWWAGAPLMLAPVLAFLVAAAINYRTNRPFASTAFMLTLGMLTAAFIVSGFLDRAGAREAFGSHYAWAIIPAGVLICMAVILLSAVAVSLATRLDVVPTITVCSLVLFAGLISDYLLGRRAPDSVLARIGYTLVPNWQHFWVVDALNTPDGIPWSYVGQVALYAAAYLGGVIALGIVAFRHMDVR